MQPSDEVIGKVVDNSPEGWALLACAVIAALFVLAKWWLPEWRKDREDKRAIEQRRVELEVKSQEDADARARERIKLTERQLDIQADQTRAIEALTAQTTVMNARLDASASRSSEMGKKVDRIDEATGETVSIVRDIRDHLIGGEGTS